MCVQLLLSNNNRCTHSSCGIGNFDEVRARDEVACLDLGRSGPEVMHTQDGLSECIENSNGGRAIEACTIEFESEFISCRIRHTDKAEFTRFADRSGLCSAEQFARSIEIGLP